VRKSGSGIPRIPLAFSFSEFRMKTCDAQRALIALGYLPPGEDDGLLGPKTRRAVETFQQEADLPVDGQLDRSTFGALLRSAAALSQEQEPSWLVKARGYVGQKEILGRRHASFILRHWVLIRAPFTDDETPWCAGFVGGVLEECGIRSSRSAAARSYLKWGSPLAGPVTGCVAVFERGPGHGHVGFAVGQDTKGHVLVLGGNQGNMVRISPFARSRVLGCRWPAESEAPTRLDSLPVLASTGALSSNEA
jgi:uncharacterized protein (TIGR02594 family)